MKDMIVYTKHRPIRAPTVMVIDDVIFMVIMVIMFLINHRPSGDHSTVDITPFLISHEHLKKVPVKIIYFYILQYFSFKKRRLARKSG